MRRQSFKLWLPHHRVIFAALLGFELIFLVAIDLATAPFAMAQKAETPKSPTSQPISSPPVSSTSSGSTNGVKQKAKARTTSKTGVGGVAAIVVTDGALVLEKPDQDSNPISQLAENTKIRVSSRPVDGVDGSKYRKMIVGKRFGYIAEIDIRTSDIPTSGTNSTSESTEEGVEKARGGKKNRSKKEAARRAAAKKRMSEKRETMFFSRFVGLLIGSGEYKEGIDGVDASTNMLFYGLKITGPDVIISGPVVDFNLALHYGAPTYYEALSQTKPTGFVLLTDLLFLAPFAHGQDSMLYFGAGPMLAFSKYAVVNSGRAMDLTQINLGLSLEIAGAVRLDKVALRLEAKYFIEKQSYKSIQAAIQAGF